MIVFFTFGRLIFLRAYEAWKRKQKIGCAFKCIHIKLRQIIFQSQRSTSGVADAGGNYGNIYEHQCLNCDLNDKVNIAPDTWCTFPHRNLQRVTWDLLRGPVECLFNISESSISNSVALFSTVYEDQPRLIIKLQKVTNHKSKSNRVRV